MIKLARNACYLFLVKSSIRVWTVKPKALDILSRKSQLCSQIIMIVENSACTFEPYFPPRFV